jgi:hypothetical protein
MIWGSTGGGILKPLGVYMTTESEKPIEVIQSEEEDQDATLPVYRILSYPSDPTLEVLVEKGRRQEITIPKFQRGWVWTHTQASRLIESFLLGLPVPQIFVYKEPSQNLIVIDGQQRLRSIWSFFEGRLPNDGPQFFLKGVNAQWEGKFYRDLNQTEQIRLRDSVLRMMVVEQVDPRDDTSIYHIFERLNTGGTALSPQEVRNCVNHGPFNDLIVDLNKDRAWRRIFGTADPETRMRDVELIVRFFALEQGLDSYIKPMKQFLNVFMKKHHAYSKRDPFERLFRETVGRICSTLGERPFHIKRGINAAVCDSVMVSFAQSSGMPDNVGERFKRLLDNPSYQEGISAGTTDIDTVKRRIRLAKEILFG